MDQQHKLIIPLVVPLLNLPVVLEAQPLEEHQLLHLVLCLHSAVVELALVVGAHLVLLKQLNLLDNLLLNLLVKHHNHLDKQLNHLDKLLLNLLVKLLRNLLDKHPNHLVLHHNLHLVVLEQPLVPHLGQVHSEVVVVHRVLGVDLEAI